MIFQRQRLQRSMYWPGHDTSFSFGMSLVTHKDVMLQKRVICNVPFFDNAAAESIDLDAYRETLYTLDISATH